MRNLALLVPIAGGELRESRGPGLCCAEELLPADAERRRHEDRSGRGCAATAGPLPRRRRDRRTRRRRRQTLRHRVRRGATRALESALPVPGRRRLQTAWCARPSVSRRSAPIRGLARGFAVVSTDTGHKSEAVFDRSYDVDQQASVDFRAFRDRRRHRSSEADRSQVLRQARRLLVLHGLLYPAVAKRWS